MAIDVSVNFGGGFLLDIVLLTPCYCREGPLDLMVSFRGSSRLPPARRASFSYVKCFPDHFLPLVASYKCEDSLVRGHDVSFDVMLFASPHIYFPCLSGLFDIRQGVLYVRSSQAGFLPLSILFIRTYLMMIKIHDGIFGVANLPISIRPAVIWL